MDDSSGAPPPHHHHHLQQQLHQRPPPQMSVGPPPHQQHLHQQQPPNSYSFQQQQQPQPRFPFSSIVTSSPQQQLKMSMDHYPDGGGGGGGGGNTSSPNNGGGGGGGGVGGGGGASSGFGIDSGSQNKKKRGRPRKISPDGGGGNNISLGLSPAPADSGAPSGGTDAFSSETPAKKHRGRPPGSGKKQQLDALGTIGIGFVPHVITVNAGEDIASKVMDFSQQGPRTVCILSANGSISSVTLRQPSTSSGTVSYEGKFEIVSMSGSFLVSDISGARHRTGGLCVSLAGADGRVLGGGVAGVLKAATPVQIVVGSFVQDEKKPKPSVPTAAAPMTTPPPAQNMFSFGNPVGTEDASPPSHGGGGSSDDASDDDDDDGGSPTDDGGAYGDNNVGEPPMQNVHMYSNMGWGNNPMKMHQQQHHHHQN